LLVCIRILMHISYILDMACLLSCFVTVNSVVYENHGMLTNFSSRFDISEMLHLIYCSCSISLYLVFSRINIISLLCGYLSFMKKLSLRCLQLSQIVNSCNPVFLTFNWVGSYFSCIRQTSILSLVLSEKVVYL
jgi:hypothetical protein